MGETFVPGASLLMDGEVTNGIAHAVVGFSAVRALGAFGPLGLLVVAVDSYSKSVTNKYLVEHVVGGVKSVRSDDQKVAAAS